jgi:deoxyribose-phosphate aldolase
VTSGEIAALIQHTNVKPDATRADVERLLAECTEYGFDGAMVAPIWVAEAYRSLAGTGVKVCTAFDYPMGGDTTEIVARGVMDALSRGAAEVDVMTKVGWLKSGMEAGYRDHLAEIVAAANGAPVKAMLEVALLKEAELVRAVDLCADAGVAYVKNSSGYGGGNATTEIVRRLVDLADGRVKVKASGGIKTLDQAMALVAAGASLLGASGSVGIVTDGTGSGDY